MSTSVYSDHRDSSNLLTCEILNAEHWRHFIDEGWQDAEIQQAIAWGVRSVSRDEAAKLLGYRVSSGGIWFPFSAEWGQLRLDRPLPDGAKYLSSTGKIGPHCLWLPPGAKLSDLAAVTEGWKDAYIATMRSGKPVGAIAGVSHVAKALPPATRISLVFDGDALTNASVMGALITGGQHNHGKIALIPQQYGAKAGFTEFYTGGGQWDELEFYSPRDLLLKWMDWLLDNPLFIPKNCDDVAALYRKLYRLAKGIDGGPKLLKKKVVKQWVSKHVTTWRKAYEAQLRAEQVLSLGAAPVGEFPALQLPPGGQRRLFALNGQKATGKTKNALKSLVQAAKAAGLSVLYYVPTQMLSRDAARVVGLTCHLDKEQAAQSHYVMSCGESAHLFRDRRWDVVIVDEVNEVLPRSWMGTLGQNPKSARAALANQIAAASIVAIAQDGLYQPVLNAVQRIGNFSVDQVEVIARRRPQSDAIVHLYQGDGYYGWIDAQLEAVADGLNISLPSGSENELTLLNRWHRQRQPEGIHKKLTGKAKSFSGDRKAFAAGPDDFISANQPNTLGFSPVFNSGVSITGNHFDAQFEYVAALETATAASQRGERVRAAICDIPRHVFIQKRGLPSLPPLEVFTAEFWRQLLSAEDRQNQPDLKCLGMGDAAKMLEKESAPIEQFPELADVLAIQAREIHFKQECLIAEWTSNGWQVQSGEIPDEDTYTELSEQRQAIREGILQSKARALAIAPDITEAESRCPNTLAAFKANVEAEGPVTAVKYQRWGIEGKLGNLPQLATPEFWAAYHLDGIGEISAAQINALLRIQLEQPELWAAMQRNIALRIVGSQAVRDTAAEQAASGQYYGLDELPTVPDLAASPRLLHTAALLGKCPGIKQIFAGELHQWNKDSEVVKAAHRWAIANATKLAALSQHSQRWYGLQFTEKTPVVKAFHKLLKMSGLEPQDDGQCDRVHQYRLKRVADVDAKIEAALKVGSNRYKLVRERYRAEHQAAIINGAMDAALSKHSRSSQSWETLETFTREHFGLCTELQKGDPNTTEVLCGPPDPPNISASDWEEFREMLSKARLMACVHEVRNLLLPIIGKQLWRLLVKGASFDELQGAML